MSKPKKPVLFLLAAALFLAAACVAPRAGTGSVHRWWSGLGPVLPHDTFPTDCKLCHVGAGWNKLVDEFSFDHEKETGYRLDGAHHEAQCLRCHNDRGPVQAFVARGCAGCHEDVHQGDLGQDCTTCHNQRTWTPQGMIQKHNRSRFPLVGAHALVSCHRCHPGARVGNFTADNECVTCHAADLANANNPPHIALGFVDNCQRCHMPTAWEQAQTR